jgi:peptide/nickel transport system substrate-binding protein
MHDFYYGPLAGQRPNYEGYINDRVTELLDEGRRTPIGPERVEIYHEIQEQLFKDLPTCPVYVRTSIMLINTSVKDWTPTSTFDVLEHNDTYFEK